MSGKGGRQVTNTGTNSQVSHCLNSGLFQKNLNQKFYRGPTTLATAEADTPTPTPVDHPTTTPERATDSTTGML